MRAPHKAPQPCLPPGARDACSSHSACPDRCQRADPRCGWAQSTAKADGEAYPVQLQVYGRRSKPPRVNGAANLRRGASTALPIPCTVARSSRAQDARSASMPRRCPLLRTISATSSGRPRRHERRSTVDPHRKTPTAAQIRFLPLVATPKDSGRESRVVNPSFPVPPYTPALNALCVGHCLLY